METWSDGDPHPAWWPTGGRAIPALGPSPGNEGSDPYIGLPSLGDLY